MAPRAATALRDVEIRASRDSVRVLATRHGLSEAQISRIRTSVPEPLPPRKRFELEVLGGTWRAACMDDGEWRDWVALNPIAITDDNFADRPCHDCPVSFAAEMRLLGHCNGSPRGSAGEPAEHNDEEEAMIAQPLTLAMPPCGSCLHEPVCVLKHALKKVTTIEAAPMQLPDGLSVALVATVECRFYNRAKKARVMSEAARASAIANAEKARAAKAARA